MNNYTDHLGNVRLSYTQDPQTGALAILEEQHYYPFGLQHKNYRAERQKTARWAVLANVPACRAGKTKIDLLPEQNNEKGLKEAAPPSVPLQNPGYMYKYNGKELQEEFGINVYDFGARNYMPDLGRWSNVDPLAEKYLSISPYTYTANNPVFFIDPDGMQVINGETARRERLETQNNAQKENIQQKYSGNLNMSRSDFQSDSDFNSYKSSVDSFNKVGEALSESKATEANIQLAIDDFKETDPTNFNLVDNLTYIDGNGNTQNIDVKIIEGGAAAYGGAFTSVAFNNKQDGSFNSIESITTTMDFSIVNPISNVLPHEMGHGYNAAKNPVQYKNDTTLLNCQDPANRNTFQAKTAKDWQARYDILKFFSQNPIKF